MAFISEMIQNTSNDDIRGGSLDSKSKAELLELLQIQDNLLKNSEMINRLADNGEKIKKFRNRVLHHIKKHEEKEEFIKQFSDLNISGTKDCIDNFEWSENCRRNSREDVNSHSIEQNTESASVTRNRCSVSSSKTLTSIEENHEGDTGDLSTHNGSSVPIMHEYAKKLCEKFDDKMSSNPKNNRFYTNKSLISDKMCTTRNKSVRDLTTAMPAPGKYTTAKLITLGEAIVLHKDQSEKFQKLCLTRLAEKMTEPFSVIKEDFSESEDNGVDYRENAENHTDTDPDE